MRYSAVIFDLFGTLVNNFPWAESDEALRRMAAELSAPPDNFAELWHAAFDERMTGAFRDYQACIQHICQQLGVRARDGKVEQAAAMRFAMNTRGVTTPREGAMETLSYLKSRGYRTGLISDCSTETTLVWGDSPLAPLIDAAVFSCLVGMKKPDPRIYRLATEKLAVAPEECAYVADGIGRELTAASELGMYAIQIRVPDEIDYDHYREEWDGPVISSLTEVLALIE